MTPMLSIAYQPTEPEETNPEPVTDTIEDILHSLDISEAQEAEQQAIDEIFLDTLNSLDAIEWTKDELGEAETDELLRASEGEEEKEVTMEEQPPNIIEAPFSWVDIRTKSEAARKASLKSISDKLARRRSAPRRPPVYAASCKRPTANYLPTHTTKQPTMTGPCRRTARGDTEIQRDSQCQDATCRDTKSERGGTACGFARSDTAGLATRLRRIEDAGSAGNALISSRS